MKNIQVETYYEGFPESDRCLEPCYFIKSDQKRLQQVFLNLYSNAIKYTDRNGVIQIITEYISNPMQGADAINISVKDNGLGIKEEDQSKLFSLFSSIRDP